MNPTDSNNSWLYGGSPCKGCTPETGRSATCHATCEKHLAWVKQKDERKAILTKEAEKRTMLKEFGDSNFSRYRVKKNRLRQK